MSLDIPLSRCRTSMVISELRLSDLFAEQQPPLPPPGLELPLLLLWVFSICGCVDSWDVAPMFGMLFPWSMQPIQAQSSPHRQPMSLSEHKPRG